MENQNLTSAEFKTVLHPTSQTKEIARIMLEMGSENARNYDLAKYFELKAQHLADDCQIIRDINAKQSDKIVQLQDTIRDMEIRLSEQTDRFNEVDDENTELKLLRNKLSSDLAAAQRIIKRLKK